MNNLKATFRKHRLQKSEFFQGGNGVEVKCKIKIIAF